MQWNCYIQQTCWDGNMFIKESLLRSFVIASAGFTVFDVWNPLMWNNVNIEIRWRIVNKYALIIKVLIFIETCSNLIPYYEFEKNFNFVARNFFSQEHFLANIENKKQLTKC